MNIFILFLNISFLLFSHHQPPAYNLTIEEVSSIIGSNNSTIENSVQSYTNRKEYKWTFHQNQSPLETETNLYYMYERYETRIDAINEITKLMDSNKNSGGFRAMTEAGDTGFIKSDNQNYCILMIVKDNHMLRLKINKLQNLDQIKAIELVAKNIVKRL